MAIREMQFQNCECKGGGAQWDKMQNFVISEEDICLILFLIHSFLSEVRLGSLTESIRPKNG